jgi:L-fucose isomerase-like protein
MKDNAISYLLILLGGSISLYFNSLEKENTYLLILGVFILMFGVYRLARTVPSKQQNEEDFIKTEPFSKEEEE